MRILFVGPSLHGSKHAIPSCIVVREPARQGDILDAVRSGASVIGLIDGCFEDGPAVWHKEILHALSRGTRVMGAASMGALRAAECERFGMIGVGTIFERYRDGIYVDDADVALIHAPRDLGYLPLSLPLVDLYETITVLHGRSLLSEEERDGLIRSGQDIFFKDRNWRRVVAGSTLEPDRARQILALLISEAVSLKRQDAEALLAILAAADDIRKDPPSDWSLSHTTYLEHSIAARR